MFVSVLLLWLLVFIFVLLIKLQRPKNFPPGPTVLPIVGNIFHLNLDNPLKDFERVRKICCFLGACCSYVGTPPSFLIRLLIKDWKAATAPAPSLWHASLGQLAVYLADCMIRLTNMTRNGVVTTLI